MGISVQSALIYYIIPFTVVLSIFLILPLPRFIKKLVFAVVEIRIEKISNIGIGVIYCLICAGVCAMNLYAYLNFKHDQLINAQGEHLEEQCTDLKNCNLNANTHNRQFRDLLIFGFGFLVSLMNFALSKRQREIYDLEDERDQLLKKAK